jgi:hypothetical protein
LDKVKNSLIDVKDEGLELRLLFGLENFEISLKTSKS